MPAITVYVSEREKDFLNEMAHFKGITLPDLLKTTTLSVLEDKYDACVADESYEAYKKELTSRPLSSLLTAYELGTKDDYMF
ncbi:toxin-antitoxin system, antitoxin component [Listeria seeligeri]|uniref:type II toxin-antitoxin system RelB family antitoxin n=1 Tax=Listeria seeligeri TaxID=1640 RepID=UPI001627FF76|nr:DUF6290 family protein [Listeria seeligeri]MBC1990407.1 toxin-antitoxin system, antitoxin component [Listeria seeligeri]MBF2375220.1 toxin-antitoxin system, antitoxin component [Listeria seeligeri]UCK61891.1 toxin-antitoxin system, antitoxin component [Listeria seeligeri]